MLTAEEISAYYIGLARRAGEVADEARQFYTQHPDDARAGDAREIWFDMLHIAVGLNGTNRVAELEAATAARQALAPDEGTRFQLALRLLHSAVTGRQYVDDEAMRAELEQRARKLARDYPSHSEGFNYLLDLARNAAPEKSAVLAREVLTGSGDEKVRAECRGLINRAEAVNHPLTLSLSLADGKRLDLEQYRGRAVLLLFWESSTRFSSKAIWAVNELYKTYHAQGLEAVGLNFDEDQGRAAGVLQDVPVDWPQYFDVPAGRKVQSQFGVHALPMCWLLDKKGVLRELKAERDPEGLVKKMLGEDVKS